jgi:hypothetical protein
LGGQLFQCEHCRAAHYSYHSCGNRHCPKCHGQQTEVWLEQQRSRLLPCAYYLLTFTLPAELRPLAYRQQKVLYGLLLKCAVASLQKLCRDPQWLGAQPSVLGVLHTWTRAMTYHPHAHFLVSAGGLSTDGQCWLEPQNPQFLVPVRALSLIFRAKMRDALKARGLLAGVPPFWRSKKWVVHAKAAGRGEKVLEYLARYVFRIAISNSRLERFENGQVTFRYRNNRTQQIKRLSLPAAQFLARYLQHVLPKGFAKVRHYGLDSSASQPRHQQAMLLLQKLRPPAQPLAKPLLAEDATPDQDQTHRFGRCPSCRIGQLVWIAELPKKIPP